MQNSSFNPPTSIRTEAPRIPDHEVLRCIGKGSYGEVWLARSLTGSLRAVKVVRREDFELDRTFEREFEGIIRFEPISRDHPGLVHILHVGRSEDGKFYYYVMELGDDRENGSHVEPGDYEARTMGTDRSMKKRLPVEECVLHGIVLADALAHLHEHGLTHRDIKPSNIIFVNGRPKLADIGLVAAAGQMTFVGTEGFVPPEGPGTAAADIYSLGMVLYELSTGNDRLQFPELPGDIGNASQRPMWRALNDVICKACAPVARKRYSSARLMAEALRAAWRVKHGRRRWLRKLVTLPVISGLLAFAIVTWRNGGAMPWPPGRFGGSGGAFLPLVGSVSLTSEPAGAEIILDGRALGHTPATLDNIPAGSAIFTLRRHRYLDASVSVSGISPGTTVQAQHAVLKFFDPPIPGQPWTNSLGMEFEAGLTNHRSRDPVTVEGFSQIIRDVMFMDVVPETGIDGKQINTVRVPPEEAARFCEVLAQDEILQGYLPEGYCYREEATRADKVPGGTAPKDHVVFRLIAEKAGSISITSDPPGAAIYERQPWASDDDPGIRLEVTPFNLPLHRTGPVKLRLKKEGYEDRDVSAIVKAGEVLEISETLKPSRAPVPGKSWQNSLGMTFNPVAMKFNPLEEVYFSIWETRVKDYVEFAKATNRSPGTMEGSGQTELHPVINVTRADAIAYGAWLTEKERKDKVLPDYLEYRLPTDAEWSVAAGSNRAEFTCDADGNLLLPDPASRHNRMNLFPWSPIGAYPPPGRIDNLPATANLGDLTAFRNSAAPLGQLPPEAAAELGKSGYEDGSVRTAPVGSFRQGPNDLFDLSGNVWELVSDNFGGSDPARAGMAVLRGASWADPVTQNREVFYTQFRRTVPPDKEASPSTGFRIVIAPVKAPPP